MINTNLWKDLNIHLVFFHDYQGKYNFLKYFDLISKFVDAYPRFWSKIKGF